MRLSCLARARRERAALRAHRAETESGHAAELLSARPARACGAARAPRVEETERNVRAWLCSEQLQQRLSAFFRSSDQPA